MGCCWTPTREPIRTVREIDRSMGTAASPSDGPAGLSSSDGIMLTPRPARTMVSNVVT
jgi:hypothetical protein